MEIPAEQMQVERRRTGVSDATADKLISALQVFTLHTSAGSGGVQSSAELALTGWEGTAGGNKVPDRFRSELLWETSRRFSHDLRQTFQRNQSQ